LVVLLPRHPQDSYALAHSNILLCPFDSPVGFEIYTKGDAFHIAFHDAVDAVGFALDVQEELYNAPWRPEILLLPDACDDVQGYRGLRVRMAIHYGKVHTHDNPVSGRREYIGETCSIAKSLEHMSHGGQVLVTTDSWNLVSFVAETKLKSPQVVDLGMHVLLRGNKQTEGVVAMGVVQLLPASMAFDYAGARRQNADIQHFKKGRQFPPPISLRQLSASFHDAPYENNAITMVFVQTPVFEKRTDDKETSVILAGLAKYISFLLIGTDGYQCKDFMVAFPTLGGAALFGLKLQEALAHELIASESLAGLLKVGVLEGTFTSMVPSPTTGRADYFGPVVNRAARVADVCDLGEVYIGRTDHSVPELSDINTEFVGWRDLKGVQEQMALFRCVRPV